MWGFMDFVFLLILIACITLPIIFSVKKAMTTSQKNATILAIFAPCYVICNYFLSLNIYALVQLVTISDLTYYYIARMVDCILKLLLCVVFFRVFLQKTKIRVLPRFLFFAVFGIPIFWDFLIKLYQTILQYNILDDALRDMLNELINIPITIIYANVSFFVMKGFIYNALEYNDEFTTKSVEHTVALNSWKITLFTPIVCIVNLFLKPVVNSAIIFPAGLTKCILYTNLFGFISSISYLILCAILFILFNKKYSIKLPLFLFLIPAGVHYVIQPFFEGLANLIYANIENSFHYSTLNNISYILCVLIGVILAVIGYFITRNVIWKHRK